MEVNGDLKSKQTNEYKLTIDELKKYCGFENMSDANAVEYIDSMEQFCIIAFKLYKQQKIKQK